MSLAASIIESAHNFHMADVLETLAPLFHCKCLNNWKRPDQGYESVGSQFMIFS